MNRNVVLAVSIIALASVAIVLVWNHSEYSYETKHETDIDAS